MDLTKITKYADIKNLSNEELMAYAKETNGIDLSSDQPHEALLSACASIFLNKKAAAGEITEPTTKPAVKEKKEALTAPVKKEKKKKNAKETEAQDKMEADEAGWPPELPAGQDFHRCSLCASAITVKADAMKDPGTGKPVCKDCLGKIKGAKTKRGETKMKSATATKKKDEEPKKKRGGGKGNNAALAKAREAMPRDKHGFREGSNVSKLFAALIKGATMEDLKEIAGGSTGKTIVEFKMKVGSNPRGRSAEIETNEKSGIVKMKSFKTPAVQ